MKPKTRLDWSDFAIIAGVPRVTSILFRKLMSQSMVAQNDVFLEQCEEYTLCHGEKIRKEKYQEDLAKKLKAVCANQWYRSLVEPVEQRVKSSVKKVFTNPEQARRFQEDQLNLNQQQLDDIINMEQRKESLFVPTINKMISNSVRVACVKAISEGHSQHITNQGHTMDIFFTRNPIYNRACASILLRLITIMPQMNPSIVMMQNSLVTYAGLVRESALSIREIEWKWSFRMLDVLKKLKRIPHLESPSLKIIFGKNIKEHGFKYVCGNSAIMNQLSFWRAAEEERRGKATACHDMTSVKDYLSQQRTLAMRELIKQPEQEEQPQQHHNKDVPHLPHTFLDESSEGEDDQGEDDPGEDNQVVVITEQVVGYKADCAIAVDVGEDPTKIYPTGTPVKVSKVTVKGWSDHMKLELLREYIRKAENPLERAPTVGGKAVYKKQLKVMLKNGDGILLEGETVKTKLSSLVSNTNGSDTLAQFLIGAGKKGLAGQRGMPFGQGGLVNIIDEWMAEQGERSVDIRQEVDKIVTFAKKYVI